MASRSLLSDAPKHGAYIGERKNHLREGFGTYKYENSFFKYEGQWKDGTKHGHGKLLMKDGSFCEGEFHYGEIQGYGFKYWSSSRNTYSGQFKLGELHGNGVMRYGNGDIYEGEWWNNKRQGHGKLSTPLGDIYDGEFHNNLLHGDGKMTMRDGSVYEGGWIQGSKHGAGVLKMADGSVYDGQWSSNVFHGAGVLMHSSGMVYEGLWVNGMPQDLAYKMQFVDVDPMQGITCQQGDGFSLKIRIINEEGQIVKDNGRALKVTAGVKYEPNSASKSNIFEAIEDVEETLIATPFGYSIFPYPLTDQALESETKTEDLESISTTQMDIGGESEEIEAKDEDVSEVSDATHLSIEEDVELIKSQNRCTSNVAEQQYPLKEAASYTCAEVSRTADGWCSFQRLYLPPPPQLYKPFYPKDEQGSKGVSKSKAKKVTSNPPKSVSDKEKDKTKQTQSQGVVVLDNERVCRPGEYVLVVEDATNPPFLNTRLEKIFLVVTVKKKSRRASNAVHANKEKTPKWDTSKHIQQSVATHREHTFQRNRSLQPLMQEEGTAQ